MTDEPTYLDLAGCAALLGVGKRYLQKQLRAGNFAAPAGHDAGDPHWREDDVWAWWATQGPDQAASVRLDLWPDPAAPAEFAGTGRWPIRYGTDEVVLCWNTRGGQVGLVWQTEPLTTVPLGERVCAADLAVLVRVENDLGIFGPSLRAVNRARPDQEYRLSWPELVRVLGQPVPFWPMELRHPEQIAAWRPGAAPVTVPARSDLDTAALLRMASMFDPEHPTHRTLLHLCRVAQQRATAGVVRELGWVAECAEQITRSPDPRRGQADAIAIAAEPLVIGDLDLDEDAVPATVRRIGWTQLLERSDVLSWQCVRQCLLWDGGTYFPFSNPEQVDPSTPQGAEWRARLERTTARPALFAQIDGDTDTDEEARFIDPLTGAPVVAKGDGKLLTAVPQRLPAHHALAEVILDAEMIWIRTTDGTLYPAPKDHYFGLSWGYPGSGPGSLALLIHRLLDDITAEAADHVRGGGPGLDALTELKWPTGTVLTREILEAARDGRPYQHPDKPTPTEDA